MRYSLFVVAVFVALQDSIAPRRKRGGVAVLRSKMLDQIMNGSKGAVFSA